MIRISLRGLLARRRRLVSAVIAIVIAVGFFSGTAMIQDLVEQGVDDLVDETFDGYDAVVQGQASQDLGIGVPLHPPVPASLVDQIASAPGVAAVEGVVVAVGRAVDEDGEPIGGVGISSPPQLMSLPRDERLAIATFTEGRPPEGPDEVAVDFTTAEQGGFEIGDTITVEASGGAGSYRLVGIGGLGDEGDEAGAGHVVVFDVETAQQLAGLADQYSYIAVAAEQGVSQDQLVTELHQRLETSVDVVTGTEYAEEQADAAGQLVAIITIFVTVMATVALFVSMFLISNTFSILVNQRLRELGQLRAIGATPRQVMSSVVVEAIAVGAAGSVLGLLAGFGATVLLKGAFTRFTTVPAGLPTLTPSIALTGFAVGIGTTVLAGLFPAVRAARTPPMAAISAGGAEPTTRSRVRLALGLLLVTAAVAAIALGLNGRGNPPVALVGMGVMAMFLATAVLGPFYAGPTSRLLSRLLPSRLGVVGRMADQNAVRSPRRTSSTAAALVIGVGLVAGMAVLVDSLVKALSSAVEEQVQTDFVISTGGLTIGGGLPLDLYEDVAALDELGATSRVRVGTVTLPDSEVPPGERASPFGGQSGIELGQVVFVGGVDPAYFEMVDLGEVEGTTELGPTDLIVNRKVADRLELSVDETVDLIMANGEVVPFTIAGITEEADIILGSTPTESYLLNVDALEGRSGPLFDFDTLIYADVAAGASPTEARSALEEAIAGVPTAEVGDADDLADSITEVFQQVIGLIYLFLFLAILLALFGVTNTLRLSILERTRELGLLRVVGITRRQVRQMVRREAVIIAVLGTVVGIATGVVFGVAIANALQDEGLEQATIPYGQLFVTLLVGAAAGMLAAVRPAKLASDLDVLDALEAT